MGPHSTELCVPGIFWYHRYVFNGGVRENPRQPSGRRASALLTVLLVSSLVLVVCLSLATTCVLNLNLASSFSTSSQSLLVAQAAIAQFTREADRFYEQGAFSPTRTTVEVPDWKTRFRQPVFPSGAERFPGGACITFDPDDEYHSFDNSASSRPAAGWRDRGTSRKSIPPYTVDLWIRVDVGGTAHYYQAALRRRWPYVLCSGGRVKLMGTPPRIDDPSVDVVKAYNPSMLLGPVYNLGRDETLDTEESSDEKVVPVSYDLADVVDLARPQTSVAARVVVGMKGVARAGRDDRFYRVTSEGNLLRGRVDVMQAMSEDDALLVTEGNTQEGGVRTGVKPRNILRVLRRVLRVPNVDEGIEIPQRDPLPAPWNRYFNLLGSGEHYVFDRTIDTRYFYYLKRNLSLPLSESAVSGSTGDFNYAADRQFVIRGSAGNRYFVPRVGRNGVETRSTPCSLTLDNCLLYVDGNLDLSSTVDVSGTRIPANLVGINATLVVNGNLVLAGADIDAQERGMVIYAKRLVGEARGHYRGLIMVQRAMALFPPELPRRNAPPSGGETRDVERLTVTGGIICGGQDTRLVLADDPTWDTRPGRPGSPPSRVIQGINLWSTTLEYDPQYLSTLHKFGPLKLMSLRSVQ